MEAMELNSTFWLDKRVLVTGHTGFKGAWLTLLLNQLGANVVGVSDKVVPTNCIWSDFFESENYKKSLTSHSLIDLRDYATLAHRISEVQPDIVFHLAAQPLVLDSYLHPEATWEVNVQGTVNLLRSIGMISKSVSIVIVTTDKVYKDNRLKAKYVEGDEIGGSDPYSASKSAVEFLVSSWRAALDSRNSQTDRKISISTARAGNVIGGGDFSSQRIIPDLVRSLTNQRPLQLRLPNAVRPWQHVLEPLMGYLQLAQFQSLTPNFKGEAFNFGPVNHKLITVGELVSRASSLWGSQPEITLNSKSAHESDYLDLCSSKADTVLKWRPILTLDEVLGMTMEWYKQNANGARPYQLCIQQIEYYCNHPNFHSRL